MWPEREVAGAGPIHEPALRLAGIGRGSCATGSLSGTLSSFGFTDAPRECHEGCESSCCRDCECGYPQQGGVSVHAAPSTTANKRNASHPFYLKVVHAVGMAHGAGAVWLSVE